MKSLEIRGQLVPFNRPKAYLCKKAQENHKKKDYLEAVSLYLRAYEAQPDAQTLVSLSRVYRDMGCYRLSNRELYRSLAHGEQDGDAFYDLAINHYHLGRREAALDSASAYLNQNPNGLYAFEAHELMSWGFMEDLPYQKRRAHSLKTLALKDEKNGLHARAVKRIKRAARLEGADVEALCDAAAFLIKTGEKRAGLRLAAKAMKRFPKAARPVCVLSSGLLALYGKRPAHTVLSKLTSCDRLLCDDAAVFEAAVHAGAYEAAAQWLKRALGQERFDTDNLKRLAYIKNLTGDASGAHRLYNRCLAIDHGDLEARDALKLLAHGVDIHHSVQALEKEALDRFVRFGELVKAEQGTIEPVDKRTLDWLMGTAWAELGDAVLHCVLRHAPKQAEDWFRMWLMDERVTEEARRRTAFMLGRMQPGKTYLMLADGALAYTRLKPIGDIQKSSRRLFIMRFLFEVRDVDDVNQAAVYAIKHFDALPKTMKERAAGRDVYAFVAALKILFLRSLKKEKSVEAYVNDLMISLRRVERAMNAFLNTGKEEKNNEVD